MSNPMETICIKYQILFSGSNKKNPANLSSAELAQRVVKVNANIAVTTDVIQFVNQSLKSGHDFLLMLIIFFFQSKLLTFFFFFL